jgi:tight adherence protein B
MVLALLTFTLTMTLVAGSYWLLVTRPEAQVAGRIRERLRTKTARVTDSPSVVKSAPVATTAAGPIGILRNWHQQYAVTAAARLIDSAGMRTDPHWLIGGTAITLTVVVIVLRIAQASWVVSLIAGALTPFVPYFYICYAARKRLSDFEEQFPDAISLMARALRAGHALTSTLALVADEVTEPVKSEFRALSQQHNYGLPLPDVLRTFAKRIPLVDVRFFATAVLLHRETGGNLAEVLDNLATVMRDRFRVRRQIRALTSQGRMTGWILGALPIVVGIILYSMNPEHMTAFVRDPVGFRLLVAALLLEIIGAVAIGKIVDVEY